MAAALDVDREQARMLCMEVGYAEASRRTGIKHGTLRQWGARGGWTVREPLPPTMQKVTVTGVTAPADALQEVISEGIKKTKSGLTKYVARMAEAAGESGTLEEAPLLKAVADIHSKMHPEKQEDGRVSLAFFSISIGSGEPEAPTVDVEAEVIRTEEQE